MFTSIRYAGCPPTSRHILGPRAAVYWASGSGCRLQGALLQLAGFASVCKAGRALGGGGRGEVGVRGALLASGRTMWSTLNWFIPGQTRGRYQKSLGFGAVCCCSKKKNMSIYE